MTPRSTFVLIEVPTRPLKGFVLSHARDYATDNWRLRAFREKGKNHPIDPAWELGRYAKCHQELREKVRAESREYRHVIFDTVWDRQRESMVIRSAFKISNVKRSTLVYREFWFCDGRPIRSPSPRMMTTKYGKKLDSEETHELLRRIESSKEYGRYNAPRKRPPASVSRQDWDAMVRASRAARSC
jgi:hypothetical protein